LRRFLHGLLVGVLTLWIPIDSAVAGWWHHHRHAMPVAWGPAFPPPCGAGAPFPGWAGAIVIDDRPLGAPSPFAVRSAAPTEVVVCEWVTAAPIEGSMIDEGTILAEGTIVGGGSIGEGDCVCDPCQEGAIVAVDEVFEGNAVGSQEPIAVEGAPLGGTIEGETVIGAPTPVEEGFGGDTGVVTAKEPVASPEPIRHTETDPEPESPTPLELPGTAAATTSGDPAAATQQAPTEAPAASVLEPWEPKTVQGDATADTATEDPVAETMEEAEAFERPGADSDDDSVDESPEDEAMEEDVEEAPAEPKRRNLFDDPPADAPEGIESPRANDDDAPVDAFEGPGSDDDFEIPEQPPMEDGDGMPADDFNDAGTEPTMDESGFEAGPDAPIDDVPADEPGHDAEPVENEAPAEADPFDSGVLHTPGQPMRSWRDDTGRHGTAGRLVEVRADRVRILKASGRHTTVPLSRLSRADRDHVAGVALALGGAAPRPGETAGL